MATTTVIPFFGINRQYQQLRTELLDAVDRVYSSGRVLDGTYTHQFESAIAERCNRRYAVAVNSCTQALIFSLQALSSSSKFIHRVLIPTVSFAATLNAVRMAGMREEFADVDDRALIDFNSLHTPINQLGIGAIMYVNLFGNTVDYARFKTVTEMFAPDVPVIEDAAQSFGASYCGQPSGSLGDISVLSFDPTKNLPNYGSGGMVLTDDPAVLMALHDLRDNGKADYHVAPGTNSKMSESDCAQMLIKLKYFDQWQQRRQQIAEYYTERLDSYVHVLRPNPGVTHAWHKFVMRISEDRDVVKQRLYNDYGVNTKIHYESPLDQLPLSLSQNFFKNADKFSKETLSLPIYPELSDAEVEHIADSTIRSL